jgi:hypothetical protein
VLQPAVHRSPRTSLPNGRLEVNISKSGVLKVSPQVLARVTPYDHSYNCCATEHTYRPFFFRQNHIKTIQTLSILMFSCCQFFITKLSIVRCPKVSLWPCPLAQVVNTRDLSEPHTALYSNLLATTLRLCLRHPPSLPFPCSIRHKNRKHKESR